VGNSWAVKGLADHLLQQLRAGRGVVRGLDDDPVAGGEHLHQGADRQVEREVPRDDVADDPFGLVTDPGPGGAEQRGVGLALVGGHPGIQVLRGVGGPAGVAEDFHQVGEQLR
jgi:hypothetical protein